MTTHYCSRVGWLLLFRRPTKQQCSLHLPQIGTCHPFCLPKWTHLCNQPHTSRVSGWVHFSMQRGWQDPITTWGFYWSITTRWLLQLWWVRKIEALLTKDIKDLWINTNHRWISLLSIIVWIFIDSWRHTVSFQFPEKITLWMLGNGMCTAKHGLTAKVFCATFCNPRSILCLFTQLFWRLLGSILLEITKTRCLIKELKLSNWMQAITLMSHDRNISKIGREGDSHFCTHLRGCVRANELSIKYLFRQPGADNVFVGFTQDGDC
jgi:hypothetical protein